MNAYVSPATTGNPTRDCKLPVALQDFASHADAFPGAWAPLNLVCPLTEFSAEFQAIVFALEHPQTELLFVDRSADHMFQWMPQDDDALDAVVCILAAHDYMVGKCVEPGAGDGVREKEGWIWVRAP